MDRPNCEICGEPMPEGEEMFKYHGSSGPCPKPPLPKPKFPHPIYFPMVGHYSVAIREDGTSDFQHLESKIGVRDIGFVRTGIELIAAERQRQMDVEGWTLEHDNEHTDGGLAAAGECYVAYATDQIGGHNPVSTVPMQWPWDTKWWKPSADPVRNLEKAGALIAAEIDRLKRKTP